MSKKRDFQPKTKQVRPERKFTQTSREKQIDTTNWIWGIHPVCELLQISPNKLTEINILADKQGDKISKIVDLAGKAGIKINRCKTLNCEGSGTHQGVEARIKPISFLSLNELLNKVKDIPTPRFLALDSIQDPHNLGAIIRSASAAGINGIITCKDRSAPMTGTVAKTAAGAVAMVNFCQVTNLSDTLNRLKDKGFWIFGADGSAEQNIYNSKLNGSLCLVIGSEGKGIRPLVKKQCDFLVSIPMHSALDSLNASVAAAIIMFEMVRQNQ